MSSRTISCIIGNNPWTKIHDLVKPAGFAVGFIALGAVGQSFDDGSAKIPWLHQQAATLHTVQTVTLPKLAAVAGCQTKRAQVATKEAAIANAEGTDVDLAAIPNCPKPSVPKMATGVPK